MFGVRWFALAHAGLAAAQPAVEEVVVRGSNPTQISDRLGASPVPVAPPSRTVDAVVAHPAATLAGQGGLLQTYAVRGIGQDRIQVQLKGVPLGPLRRAGVSADFADPLLFDAEVDPRLRATQDGAGALGGVVNLSPRRQSQPWARLGYEGNGDQSLLSAGAAGGAFNGAVSYRRADNQDSGADTELNPEFEHLSALLGWQRETLSRSDSLTVLLSRGEDIGKSNVDFPDRTTTYPDQDNVFVAYQVKHASWGDLTAWSHYQSLDTRAEESDSTSKVDTSAVDYGFRYLRPFEFRGTGISAGPDLFGRADFDVSETRSDPAGATSAQSVRDGARQQWGAHLTAHRSLGPWDLEAGSRLLHYHAQDRAQAVDRGDVSESELVGHIGLNYTFSPTVAVAARLGSAVVSPTVSQLFFSGTTGRGQIIGNTNLRHEDAWTAETTLRFASERRRLNLGIYRIEIDDVIDRQVIDDSTEAFVNGDSATIRGFYASTGVDWTARTQAELVWSVVRGETDEDRGPAGGSSDHFPDIPNDEVTASIHHRRAAFDARVSARYRWDSHDIAAGNRFVDAATLIEATLGFQPNPSIRIELYGRNLLDQSYWLTNDRKSALGAGRSFGVVWHATL